MNYPQIRVATVQASPIYPLDRDRCVDKICTLLEEAAREKARLVVFPETFIPAYPNFSIDLSRPTEWQYTLRQFIENAVEVPGPEMSRIARLAAERGINVVLGVNEKVAFHEGLLFNTQVFIGADGRLLGKRRKLFPTNREKVFWGYGGAEDIQVFPMDVGRVGGLICYEHLQPLLKYATMIQGEQIHCASWPGWPEYKGGRSNRHLIDAASRQYAIEAQCFVVVSSIYVDAEKVPPGLLGNAAWGFFGGSGILNPLGEYLAGPVYGKEGILYAELDMGLIPLRKTSIDPTGRDERWNILSLNLFKAPVTAVHLKPPPGEIAAPHEDAQRSEAILERLERIEKLLAKLAQAPPNA